MGRFLATVLILIAIAGSYYYFKGNNNFVDSPLPKVYGATEKKVFPRNAWFPKMETAKDNYEDKLSISANSALVVDFETGEVLYAKNPKAKQPVASTVKIMTALLALDYSKLDREFSVSEKAAKIGENSMLLETGERLSLEKLLYGLMLVSGNDAAVAIAEGVSGSEEAFVAEMNNRLDALGVGDTKFVNASGLDEDDKQQYSTAYDMAVIARYLWETHPEIRDIASTYHKFIEQSSTHKAFEFYNDTNLLTTYPGVKGIKPGFTWEAGLCLVTYAENDGKKILAVLLGSEDRRGEMKELLDYGFGHYGIHVEHPDLDL